MFKQSMITLAALAVLVSLSGVSKAEGEENSASDGYKQLTCAEAAQAAWFRRQMELTDGDTSPEVPVPPECSRELIATAAAAAEESK